MIFLRTYPENTSSTCRNAVTTRSIYSIGTPLVSKLSVPPRFFANLEHELLRLESELQIQTYRTGRYLEIVVRDPKRRVVSAAPFATVWCTMPCMRSLDPFLSVVL